MKIAILSNVNFDLLIKSLSKKNQVYETEGYGQWVSYALTPNEKLTDFTPQIIFVLLDGNALLETSKTYEEGLNEISQNFNILRNMADNYKNSTLAISTIDIKTKKIKPGNNTSNCEMGWIYNWNQSLDELCKSKNNVIVFDLKEFIEKEGRDSIYADNMWYMGSIPYSVKGLSKLSECINTFIGQYAQTRKKVLVCDLDNTLWGGVIGEDGPKGITLSESLIGAVYRDTQKRIKEIAKTGILLAIVSKNNQEDADSAFENNPYMVLQKKDFVSIKCNWKAKSENIEELAQELNLGIDSFVFLDDNPVEREEVKIRLPHVEVIDFPKDVANLPKTIEKAYRQFFWCQRLTSEDLAKTEQYHQETLRKRDMASASSLEEYLLSLNIRIGLGEVKEEQIPRTVQLLNKTNQFNTNTRRFTQQEFMEYLNTKDNHVFVANVSDRYGDNGLVVILMIHKEKDEAYIDNFLMSCRVMGRKIEDAVMSEVCKKMAELGIKVIHASYLKTAKNKPVECLYEGLGFELKKVNEDCLKEYFINLPSSSEALLKVIWE